MSPHEWTFLEERFDTFGPTTTIQGNWLISSAISKPRNVFIWVVNAAKLIDQTRNLFFHDTFDIAGNHAYLSSCQLEVGNGNFYPTEALNQNDDKALAYRMLMSYNRSYNDRLTGS